MTKRRVAWSCVVLLAFTSLVVGLFGLSGTRTIRVGESEIQKRVEAQLPKEHKGVRLTKATVNLLEYDVRITLTLEGKALGQSFSLEASGVGVPDYRQEEQAFYFLPSKLTVSKLEYSGESATDKMGKFADRYITDPKLKEKVEKSLPGVKQWVEDNLEPRVLSIFGNMPLYKPKNDMKGIVIKATLEKLSVENGALVLSFSLLQLTKTVIFCLLTLLGAIVMVGALLAFPGWGLAVIVVGSLGQ